MYYFIFFKNDGKIIQLFKVKANSQKAALTRISLYTKENFRVSKDKLFHWNNHTKNKQLLLINNDMANKFEKEFLDITIKK